MPPEKAKSLFAKLRADVASGKAEKIDDALKKPTFQPIIEPPKPFVPWEAPKSKASWVDHVAKALKEKEREADEKNHPLESPEK